MNGSAAGEEATDEEERSANDGDVKHSCPLLVASRVLEVFSTKPTVEKFAAVDGRTLGFDGGDVGGICPKPSFTFVVDDERIQGKMEVEAGGSGAA